MKKNKKTYSTPEVETLVVRFEDSVLQSGSPYGAKGAAGANLVNADDEYDL